VTRSSRLIFATFGTEGTDSTVGGNTEWLITDHWSAAIGFDAFLGKSHQHNIGSNAAFQAGHTAPQDAAYSETIFGPSPHAGRAVRSATRMTSFGQDSLPLLG